jgi:ribosomal protein S18 acetylase RimI-like enzyme
VSAGVREVATKDEALAYYDDRFLRWQVTSSGFQRAWVTEKAAVLHRLRDTQPQLIALGAAHEVGELLETAAATLPAEQLVDRSVRLTVEAEAAAGLPGTLRMVGQHTDRWEWMWSRTQPPAHVREREVRWTEDMDAVKALLATANPRHHGRPGDPDIRGWAAVHDSQGVLLCTGALADLDTGVPHLRSITTNPHARGRGLGAAVSAFLTREALRSSPPAVTLGLYSDNGLARRLYRRLGYQPSHALVSGPVVCA